MSKLLLTKAQLEELRTQLALLGIRDTDLPETPSVTSNDYVAIVQDEVNKKVRISEIFGPEVVSQLIEHAYYGKSAYEIAVENGFDGTEQEWLESLSVIAARHTDGKLYWMKDGQWLVDESGEMILAQGTDGKDGKDGSDGKDGKDGKNGVDGATDIQFMYSSIDNPGTPASNPELWSPYGTTDDKYMALRVKRSGEWEDIWTVLQFRGADGSAGIDAITGFKQTIYKRYASKPSQPTGGTFGSPVPEGWSDYAPSSLTDEKLWISSRWFYSDNALTNQTSWSDPVSITDTSDIYIKYSAVVSPGDPDNNPDNWHYPGVNGDIWMAVRIKKNSEISVWSIFTIKGADGADGTSITIKGTVPTEADLSDIEDPQIGDIYIDEDTGDAYVWNGEDWINMGNIVGQDGTSSYIWVAFSNDGGVTLTGNNGLDAGTYFGYCIETTGVRPFNANAYSWSRHTGQDGNSFKYIYKATTTEDAPDVPSGGSSHQDMNWVPDGWSDDPVGINLEYQFCWMCYRMRTNGVWSNFIGNSQGKAVLWSKWGLDGAPGVSPNTAYKSLVFKRAASQPSTPTGGSYASPVPSGWSDGIPAGTGIVWMSTRIFSSDGASPQQSTWTTPKDISDEQYMDYIFSSEETPAAPTKANPSDTATGDWYEYDDCDETTIWMAIRNVIDGAYEADSTWAVIKIKGESGEDGKSVNLKGSVSAVADLPDSGNVEGDAYNVGPDSNGDYYLYVWDGDSWENAGKFNGADGKSAYIHIKYSNDGGQTFTDNSGETPGSYLGICHDNNSVDPALPSAYTWTYWEAQDGFGYEWIYTRGSSANPPTIPTAPTSPSDTGWAEYQADDFVPTGWDDDPMTLTSTYRYGWKCYRKKTDGVWGPWIGNADDNTKAAFEAYLAQNGSTGTSGYNTASIDLYRRAPANSTPASLAVSGSVSFNFTSNTISGNISPWTRTHQAPNQNGDPEWVTSVQVASRNDSITISSSSWSTPVILVQDGAQGPAGPSPAYVFRGEWAPGETYYGSTTRRDIVKYAGDGKYYVAAIDAGEFVSGNTSSHYPPNSSKWMSFGVSYANIATGFLFTEESYTVHAVVDALETSKSGDRINISRDIMTVYDTDGESTIRISGQGLSANPGDPREDVISNQSNALPLDSAASNLVDPSVLYSGTTTGQDINVLDGEIVTFPPTTINTIVTASGVVEGTEVPFGVSVSWVIDGEPYHFTNPTAVTIQGNGTFSNSINMPSFRVALKPGTHHISLRADLNFQGYGTIGNVRYSVSRNTSSTLKIVKSINAQLVELCEDGFRVRFGSTQLMQAIISGDTINFMMRADGYGIEVTANGIRLLMNNTWHNVSTATISGNTVLTLS